ncbi:hypothetical protein NUU61_007781 [Penicillium alfredii]|uniref:Mcm2 3 5 family protein n=1 Tax=Penicillium alfredii TaxID=1506179 RepID=A0A9W9JYC4_9EURO|nr:uncharacterized protein NUU61_007781 [Penicillium alfredii]KAJ5086474.1 hypothetical protein NUU61_007781 [Penicillium alfredii]
MAESRESQHSLLSSGQPMGTRPPRSWHPLGRSSPELEDSYYYPPPRRSSSDEAFREVGLGITNSRGDKIPAHQRHDSVASTSTVANSPQKSLPPRGNCPNRSNVLQKRLSWVPMTILVLSLYATVFSGIYLAIALWKPRWKRIASDGPLAPSTASLLSSFFAKTIELSYVTVCVAFLGQVLSRRALMGNSRGISISDMSMRAWIMQPGSMIVHWETLRYSGLTLLGSIALIATFVAMLYTTAAQALVSPKLSLGPVEPTTLWGKVSASWGNSEFLGLHCRTPISMSTDPEYRNTTCLQMEHVGQAYHNYRQWITHWSNLVHGSNKTSDKLKSRPHPTGSLYDNTTVTGSWIDVENMTELSKKHGRMVNNITMAMPHGGVLAAAMDARNGIRQPQEASGEGKYNVEASVPSPAVNVLCVGMTKLELSPLVYTEWPHTQGFNATTWYTETPTDIPLRPSWLNRTVVDDLFEFGEKYGQRPPVFGKYPKLHNTLLNTTGLWPANAIFLLGAAPAGLGDTEYVMCAVRAKQTGACSTRYSAASSGASLRTKCESPKNDLQYNNQNKHFQEGVWEADWKNIASEWASSLSLGTGITDGAASNARLLMQLMPAFNKKTNTFSLDPNLPSIAEALAVMSGNTLILSSQDAPFVQGWNYTGTPNNILAKPVYQYFRASVQTVGYASGWAEKWQVIFYVILVFAFVTSAICLAFMILEARGRQVTDFTEPQNLFTLAINSPQTDQLQGACGSGPHGRQFKERWHIDMEENDEHYYIRSKADVNTPYLHSSASSRLEPLSMGDPLAKPVSPAVDEFRRVSKRHSFLARLY